MFTVRHIHIVLAIASCILPVESFIYKNKNWEVCLYNNKTARLAIIPMNVTLRRVRATIVAVENQ